MAKSLAIGDVLEIDCPNGLAYVSYAGTDLSLGDAIWVVPRVFATAKHDFAEVFAADGFHVYYPANLSLRKKLLRHVGYCIDAIHGLPPQRRNAVQRDSSGKVLRWLIVDANSQVPRSDDELTASERQLPISQMWNHPLLVERIEEGWLPGQ